MIEVQFQGRVGAYQNQLQSHFSAVSEQFWSFRKVQVISIQLWSSGKVSADWEQFQVRSLNTPSAFSEQFEPSGWFIGSIRLETKSGRILPLN